MLEIVREFPFPCRCTCLSMSAETNLSGVPNSLSFCAAGSDFKIRIIKSDLENESFCKVYLILLVVLNIHLEKLLVDSEWAYWLCQ